MNTQVLSEATERRVDTCFDAVVLQHLAIVRQSSADHGPGLGLFFFTAHTKATGENCKYTYCSRDGFQWNDIVARVPNSAVIGRYEPATMLLIAVFVPVDDYTDVVASDVRLFDAASGQSLHS